MRNLSIYFVLACCLFAVSCSETATEEVNVYTHRHYAVDKGIFDSFEQQTGIRVNVINASADELIQRMETEGVDSPADLLITVDAGRLNRATERGLLQPVTSDYLNEIVPNQYREPDGHWYGMSIRARVIAYSKDRVNPEAIQNYEDLADPVWKDKVLVRTSDNVYNQSLISSLIAANGEEATLDWAKGIVTNLARDPKGSDRDQVKAIAGGEGDLTVVNTYYIGQLLNSDSEEERKAAEAVGVIFPNQDNRGTHVNISGFGVARYAKNKENAMRLAEFLLSKEVQHILVNANYEYPVHQDVEMAELLKEWGDFKRDNINLSLLGLHNEQALRIADEAGWN